MSNDMEQLFTKDDTVFLADGTECIYISGVPSTGKHIVDEVSTFGLNNDLVFNTLIVDEVYPDPPIRKRHEEVTRLDNLLREKRDQVRSLEQALFTMQGEVKNSRQVMAKHKALTHIDDFLEHRIKYVVQHSYWNGISISTFEDAFKEQESGYAKDGMKLLTLYGKSSGDLQWKINRYTDGSGSDVDIYPCYNREDIKTKIQELLDTIEKEFVIRDFSADRLQKIEKSLQTINQRLETDLHLPNSMLAAMNKKIEMGLSARRAHLLKEVEEINEKLAR